MTLIDTLPSSTRSMPRELRTGRRLVIALPVTFEGGSGVTRDVSTSGLYLVTPAWMSPGAPVELVVEFTDSLTGSMTVQCDATIRRVERCGDAWGIAAAVRW